MWALVMRKLLLSHCNMVPKIILISSTSLVRWHHRWGMLSPYSFAVLDAYTIAVYIYIYISVDEAIFCILISRIEDVV